MDRSRHAQEIAAGASVLLESPSFLGELEQAAAEAGQAMDKARRYAAKCLKEIEATPSESWFAPAARLARFIYTRSYDAEMDINRESLQPLQAEAGDHLLLFLWSHKSHMDSFVFMLSLYDNQFRPLPLVFAGINMNFFGFGALARRVGAIFLRRSFRDDPIYRLVFRHYIDYLVRHRIPLTWSIEGTRSRTGRLSPPKLGILNWVLEACERAEMRDVKLVPVAIAFDRIAEIDDYVALQRGMPKRRESLGWFINFIFGMKEPYGKIYVRYAEPVGLDDVPEPHDRGSGTQVSLATRLAFETCTRIQQITPIKSADVLAMVLLAANGRALTLPEITRQAQEITAVVKARQLPVATGFRIEDEEQVGAAVLSMTGAGMLERYDKGSTEVFYIPEGQQLAAAYYSNTITHYFLAAALGELGLARLDSDISRPSEQGLRRAVDELRDLFKFEFFFQPTEVFWQEVLEETNRHYPAWSRAEQSLYRQLRQQPPRFGHAILRGMAEAYHVIAMALETQGDTEFENDKRLTTALLHQGREMLLRRYIDSAAAISKDLFVSGLRQAEYRELLSGEKLGERRRAYARETRQVLAAVNLLQRAYDAAWFGDEPR
jgi:glycerol-3-phosphate O-acyltransferase